MRLIELATVVMLILLALMIMLTVSVKALRHLKVHWYKRHFERIEPALENFVLTGEDQPELSLLRPWQRDLFLSRLINERLVLLRGAGRQHLMRLAEDMGLVDRNLRALKSRRRWNRARAAENLGYFGGERSTAHLAGLLSDENETIRAVAARSLARIGSGEAVRLLIQTLDDSSELTRLRVAENLERLGHLAVGPLVNSLEDVKDVGNDHIDGRVMAARVLGNLRASEAREALSQAVRDSWSPDVRAQATLALGKIGDPEDVPTLLDGTKDASWPVRAQAANALGMIGEVSTVPALKELAADGEWWVRLNACKALANMGPEGEKALLELLLSEDRYARDRAAATLESRGVTRRMVRRLAASGRKGERARTIIGALIKSGTTKYLRGLSQTLPEGKEREILRGMLEIEDEPEPPVDTEHPGIALAKTESGINESPRVEPASAEPPGAEQIDVDPASIDESLGAESADPRWGTGGDFLQIVQQPKVESRQSSSKEQPAVTAKGEASHAVRIFRRSTQKAEKNPSIDVQRSPASPAQTPQKFELRDSAAASESCLEDAGDRVAMDSDHLGSLAQEDETVSNLIRDPSGYVGQVSKIDSKLEEDARKISELCDRLEYETAEVDSLRIQIEEKISRIRNVVDSGETELESYKPDEPQSGWR